MEVKQLTNPKGLKVEVPILDVYKGYRALIKEAEKTNLIPSNISTESMKDTPEPYFSIILWGAD